MVSTPEAENAGASGQITRVIAPWEGGRIDVVLAEQLGDLSRSRIQKLIEQGDISVEGQVILKPAHQLHGGEEVLVHLPPPSPSKLIPEAIPLNIVYEDERLLVVNKPAGMVVHPSPGHSAGTLVQAVLAHAPDLQGVGGVRRPGVVHRLDKDTSGLILFAKDDRTMRFLQRQFKDRDVEKSYQALVEGRPPTRSGEIQAPVGRDPKHRKRMAVVDSKQGRPAMTRFRTLEKFEHHTLLEVNPHTGRTHQIRVHLASIGHPVVGDRVYGRRHPTLEIDRQFLHAWKLSLRLPGERGKRTFETALPEDLMEVLRRLRAG